MIERIQKICREVCGREVGKDELLLASGVLDSFKLMELICSLEEEFHILFEPEEIMELDYFSSVGQMAEIVGKKAGRISQVSKVHI